MPRSKIVNRVCEFIDKINGKDKKGELREISSFENGCGGINILLEGASPQESYFTDR